MGLIGLIRPNKSHSRCPQELYEEPSCRGATPSNNEIQPRRNEGDEEKTRKNLRALRFFVVDSLRSLHVALRRLERMKSAVRSPAFRPQAFDVTEWVCIRRFRLKAGLRTDFPQEE